MNSTKKKVLFFIVAVLVLFLLESFLYKKGYEIGEANRNFQNLSFQQSICEHSWKNGKCQKCGISCPHFWSEDHVCKTCGYKCPHKEWTDDHVCTLCGYICTHQKWEDGVCKRCGAVCGHEEWENGVCVTCGAVCEHENWIDGACPNCGLVCEHENWDKGVCTNCGLVCPHTEHDRETVVCKLCGELLYHDFTHGGVCSCGEEVNLITTEIPEELLQEPTEAGEVGYYSYEAENADGTVENKNICVYTPPGYDETQKYDVLLLVHGSGDNENAWLTNVYNYGSNQVKMQGKTILDNMISKRYCRPVIVVTFLAIASLDKIADEIRYDILPFTAKHYSTYADVDIDAPVEDYIAAIAKEREHFGIAGLSNGSLYTYSSGWRLNFELMSNFGCFSGCTYAKETAQMCNSDEFIDLPVNCFYSSAGQYDAQLSRSKDGYNYITEHVERVVDGENAFFTTIEGAGHDYTTWFTSLYNALRLFY